MMSNKMICEANLNLPQKFDINMLRKSDEPYSAAQESELKTAGVKPFLKLIPADYNVLPTFNYQNENLRSILSLKDNDYLLCRWHQFLNNVPEFYVQIRLYHDYLPRKSMLRRMQLNGQFYGVDNKLAPVPVSPDPRQYTIHCTHKCAKDCMRPPKSTHKNDAKHVAQGDK